MTNSVTQELLATLDVRYKAAKAELEEVKRLRAAIKAVSIEEPKPIRKRSRKPEDGPTFKEMIKSVLTDKGEGADALKIIELIKEKYDKDIMRTSISPQLSRLKASGDLVLHEKIWMLPAHYNAHVFKKAGSRAANRLGQALSMPGGSSAHPDDSSDWPDWLKE